MTPWDSDWAGGTEGSDLRIAKEYGLDPRQIETAKVVASEVFPLERGKPRSVSSPGVRGAWQRTLQCT